MTLVVLAAAWIAGLLIGLEMGLEMDVYLPALVALSLAALLLACLFRLRRLPALAPVLALAALAGLLRVEAVGEQAGLSPLDSFQPVKVRGLITSDPEVSGPGVEFVLSVDAVDVGEGWLSDKGRVLVFARPTWEMVEAREEPYFRYGDTLELTGRLEEPPFLGDFDYPAYLAAQGIHHTMPFPAEVYLVDEGGGSALRGLIYGLRRRVSESIDSALPEPHASLAQALLLGLRGRMPQEITEDFRSTGTSHLLAISGLHVGVLLAVSLGASVWLVGRRRQLYLALPLGAIWLYALVSGLSPSVERAAIMGSIYLLALAIGRPRSILPALGLAAAVMAAIEPQILRQVSFQLSFTAVAGIALLTHRVNTGVTTGSPAWWEGFPLFTSDGGGWRKGLLRALLLVVAVSVAATLATLPLIAFNFHRIPTLGIPATVMALPALPFLLITSAISAIFDMVHPQVGQAVGWSAWVFLEYILQIVRLFAQVPGSAVSVPSFNSILVWAYYTAFALLVLVPGGPGKLRQLVRGLAAGSRAGEQASESDDIALGNRTQDGGRLPVKGTYLVAGVGLAVFTGLLWSYIAAGPDGKLHVHFLDVGQGDSILIVTPEGRQVLVDGGPGEIEAVGAVGSRLPFMDRDLDMVVATHPDEDHFRGLIEVLDRYRVDAVLESSTVSTSPLYQGWRKVLEDRQPQRIVAVMGQTIALDGSTRLEVLNPPARPIRGVGSDSNNNGVVLRLVYDEVSFLLTADIEAEVEERLVREGYALESTVLKVSHHGSRSSTTPQFLAAVSPRAAVVSAGADNPYGHPHPEVMGRLKATLGEEMVYLTAEQGDIEFITDGKRLWIKEGGK